MATQTTKQTTQNTNETFTTRETRFVTCCNYRLEMEREDVARFAAKLADPNVDPLYEMEWSGDVFRSAAVVAVYGRAVRYMTDPNVDATPAQRFDALRRRLQEDVLHKAQYPSSSTSPASNLAAVNELAAMAKLLEEMDKVAERAARQ